MPSIRTLYALPLEFETFHCKFNLASKCSRWLRWPKRIVSNSNHQLQPLPFLFSSSDLSVPRSLPGQYILLVLELDCSSLPIAVVIELSCLVLNEVYTGSRFLLQVNELNIWWLIAALHSESLQSYAPVSRSSNDSNEITRDGLFLDDLQTTLKL